VPLYFLDGTGQHDDGLFTQQVLTATAVVVGVYWRRTLPPSTVRRHGRVLG
jgi:hypothetical protein